jgi:hypothetical protein
LYDVLQGRHLAARLLCTEPRARRLASPQSSNVLGAGVYGMPTTRVPVWASGGVF